MIDKQAMFMARMASNLADKTSDVRTAVTKDMPMSMRLSVIAAANKLQEKRGAKRG